MEALTNAILDVTLGLAVFAAPVCLGIAGAYLFDIARKVYTLVSQVKL